MLYAPVVPLTVPTNWLSEVLASAHLNWPERLQILDLRLVLLELGFVLLDLLGVLGHLLGVAHHVGTSGDGGLDGVQRVADDVLRPHLRGVRKPARANDGCGGKGIHSAFRFHGV